MHKAAPSINWHYLESQNRMQMHKDRIASRVLHGESQDDIANGKLIGQWHERGSNNQAGPL